MSDCCKQMANESQAIKSELAALKGTIAQKPNKGEIPNLVKGAMAGALPLLLPQALNKLPAGSIPNLVSKIQAPPLQLLPRQPLPTDVVLSPNNARNIQQAQQALAQQNRALQNTVNQLQRSLRPLQTQLDKLSQLGQKLQPLAAKVTPILNAASLATSLASAGISIGNLIVMVKRFNQIDRNEAVTINALSDLLTKIGVLNSRTKNLQEADIKLNNKIEKAIDLSESNKIAINLVARDLNHTNGVANTAIIQARRAEANIQKLNTTATSNRALNQQLQNQITTVAQQTKTANQSANSALRTATQAQTTAIQAQTTATQAQTTATQAQTTANHALSNSRSALSNTSGQYTQQPINVINQTIVQPIQERTIQKTETIKTQVVQTREIHTREIQTREVQILREVEVIDPQTKAAIARIEGISIQNQNLLTNQTGQLTNIGNQTTNIQNGVLETKGIATQNQTLLNQQTNKLTNIGNQTTNIQNGVVESNNRLQNLSNRVDEGITKTKERFDKLSQRLKLPEILNALTLIVVLHNAAMLSKSLVETLGDVLSTGLAIIGLKDEEGNAIDINQVVGRSVTNFIQSIIGEQVYNNLVTKWNLANRTYQSAANIVSSIRSIGDSTMYLAQESAERIGIIGNALRRDGVVREDSYKPMSERVSRGSVLMDRSDRLDDTASAINSIVGEVKSIQDEATELQKGREELIKTLQQGEPKPQVANKPIEQKEAAVTTASKAPTLTETDEKPHVSAT